MGGVCSSLGGRCCGSTVLTGLLFPKKTKHEFHAVIHVPSCTNMSSMQ